MARLGPRLPILFFCLCLFFLFYGCASYSAPPASRALQRRAGVYHVVRNGETLYRIGQAYDVSYRRLARINGIADPNRIRVGQEIFIPGATGRLPVEIITPERVSIERPVFPDQRAKRDGFIWPVVGNVTSGFGPRSEVFHDGIDISAPTGSPIRAIDDGEVIYSGHLRGYGNLVIIRHSNGLASVYGHNQKNLVREGQRTARGDIVAEVGSTGRVTGPHLHFEIRKDNVAQDPLYYLPPL